MLISIYCNTNCSYPSSLCIALSFFNMYNTFHFFYYRKVCKTNSSAVYFGSLAIVETIYLMFHVISELQAAWGYNTYHSAVVCELFNFLLITPQYLVRTLYA